MSNNGFKADVIAQGVIPQVSHVKKDNILIPNERVSAYLALGLEAEKVKARKAIVDDFMRGL